MRTKQLIKINSSKRQEVVYDSTGFTVIDEGHSLVKGRTDASETSFVHALVERNESEWATDKSRGFLNNDYYIVNGKRYVIGEEAERLEPGNCKRTGADRYIADYYGVLGAITLFRLHADSHEEITAYASHAPEYINYRPDVKAAIKGRWTVEDYRGKKKTFRVVEVLFYDEPMGGAMNLILTPYGDGFQNDAMRRGRMLNIDIGGYTVNVAYLINGRIVDVNSDTNQGVISALDELKGYLRKTYQRQLKSINEIDPKLLREALETGFYDGGGHGMLDVQDAANRASGGVMNAVQKRYNSYGGVGGSNNVSLSGGGSGAYEQRLRKMLEHPSVYLAAEKPRIHFANADGGMRMMHFYKLQEAF